MPSASHRHRQQQIVAALFEQGVIDDGAGSDDARDLAFDQSLGFLGIADLLGDGDRLAELDQFGQIAIERVHRDAGHRDRLASGLSALGQRDFEQAGGSTGIVVENLVEVAHAEQQQQIRLLRLQRQVLAHQRRMFRNQGRRVRHAGSAVQ